jgi:hypothetical protein
MYNIDPSSVSTEMAIKLLLTIHSKIPVHIKEEIQAECHKFFSLIIILLLKMKSIEHKVDWKMMKKAVRINFLYLCQKNKSSYKNWTKP